MDNTTVSTAGRSYDTFGRIASISNGTDTLSYTYVPGGQLSLSGWTNGQNVAMSNQSYEYDQYNRLTGIKLNNVNEVSYTLNAKDQRTARPMPMPGCGTLPMTTKLSLLISQLIVWRVF